MKSSLYWQSLHRAWTRFFNVDALRKRIQGATSLMAVLQILVVGLTFLKEIVMTSFLGLAQFMDAYTLVNNILIFTRSYFEQLGYGALIPSQGELAARKSEQVESLESLRVNQQRFLVVVLNYSILVTLFIAFLVCVFHQFIAWLIAPTWSEDKLKYLILLTWLLIPICLLFQVAEMLRVLCIQQKRFILYQLPRIASLMVFIVGFIGLLPVMGPSGLIIALPVSQLLELLMYCFGLKIRPQWVWQAPGMVSFWKKVLPVSLSWGVFSLSLLVDNFFLSFLPTGEPSAFRYAYVSVLIAGSLTVVNLQMVKLSDLNHACLEKDIYKTIFILKKACSQILLLSLPLIIGSVLLAPWLIQVVYQRGAFTAHNTFLVAQCYQVLILLVPYTALWRLISSCYYNWDLTRPLVFMGLGLLLARIGMDWVGLKLFGLSGIAWMVLLNSYLLLFILGWFLVRFRNKITCEKEEA